MYNLLPYVLDGIEFNECQRDTGKYVVNLDCVQNLEGMQNIRNTEV